MDNIFFFSSLNFFKSKKKLKFQIEISFLSKFDLKLIGEINQRLSFVYENWWFVRWTGFFSFS